MKPGSIEMLKVGDYKFLLFTKYNLDGSPNSYALADVPETRNSKKATNNQPRWLKGSYLTEDQVSEEEYQTQNHIA